jgi:hypothetical protein
VGKLSFYCIEPRGEMCGKGEALAKVDPTKEEEGVQRVALAILAVQLQLLRWI